MSRNDRSHDVHDERDHPLDARRADVRSKGVRVDRLAADPGVVEARRHFGGLDLLATLAGLLATIGTLVLLGGLVGAAGSIGYELSGGREDPSVPALAAGLAVLLVAFFTGGWVAGRVARYDGGRNGFISALEFLVLAAALAGLGAWLGERYDVFSRLELPQWFSGDDLGTKAIISAIVGAAVALLAGWLGGTIGARYHRRADAVVTHTRDGGLHRSGVMQPGVAGQGQADLATSDPSGAASRPGR